MPGNSVPFPQCDDLNICSYIDYLWDMIVSCPASFVQCEKGLGTRLIVKDVVASNTDTGMVNLSVGVEGKSQDCLLLY